MRVYFQTFVDEQIYCCDKPIEIREVYDIETKEESALIRCQCCKTTLEIIKKIKDIEVNKKKTLQRKGL